MAARSLQGDVYRDVGKKTKKEAKKTMKEAKMTMKKGPKSQRT